MTRAEHVEWCKVRAREYLAKGDIADAVTSMGSDMDQREDTKVMDVLMQLGMLAIMQHDRQAASRWIEGFN